MKKLAVFLFACTLLFSGQVARTYTIAPQGTEEPGSKRAREVIERTIQAMGGEAFVNAPGYFYTGRASGFSKGELNALSNVLSWTSGDKQRIEREKVPGWITIFNGDKGWDLTYHGMETLPQKLIDQRGRAATYSLGNVLRKWTRDPKTIYFYDGERYAEARQSYSVTMINGENLSATLLIEQQTYLPLKESWSGRDPEYHDKFEESVIYDKYRTVQGIQTPFIVTRYRNGEMTGQTFVNTAKYMNMPEQIFSPDYKAPAPR
ncbi:MAG: hypothetical protein NVS9B15_19800 [Acidobacteriaceae bacterium]